MVCRPRPLFMGHIRRKRAREREPSLQMYSALERPFRRRERAQEGDGGICRGARGRAGGDEWEHQHGSHHSLFHTVRPADARGAFGAPPDTRRVTPWGTIVLATRPRILRELRRRGESLERLHESHRKRATERELDVWMHSVLQRPIRCCEPAE